MIETIHRVGYTYLSLYFVDCCRSYESFILSLITVFLLEIRILLFFTVLYYNIIITFVYCFTKKATGVMMHLTDVYLF